MEDSFSQVNPHDQQREYSSQEPVLRYKDFSSAWEIFEVLSDESSLRAEIEIAKKEHPLKWTEYVLNNFHNLFPGGYKWKYVVEENQKDPLYGEKFKTDFERVLKSLCITKPTIVNSVDRREQLSALIRNYDENFERQREWYDTYMRVYLGQGRVSKSDFRKHPKQLYLKWVEGIKKISNQRGDIYIEMRKLGYSHKELCE